MRKIVNLFSAIFLIVFFTFMYFATKPIQGISKATEKGLFNINIGEVLLYSFSSFLITVLLWFGLKLLFNIFHLGLVRTLDLKVIMIPIVAVLLSFFFSVYNEYNETYRPYRQVEKQTAAILKRKDSERDLKVSGGSKKIQRLLKEASSVKVIQIDYMDNSNVPNCQIKCNTQYK